MSVQAAQTNDHVDNEFLTPPEVANLLRLSLDTLASNRSRRRGLPFYKIFGRILYRRKDVNAALKKAFHPIPTGGRP